MTLQENIRQYRKGLDMTQEQLAEAMGVTVGAVSKWESGASTPDLGTLMGLAELFQTSMDALLDFRLRGAGAEEQAAAIKACTGERAYERGRAAAEKALRSFPNHFQVVYRSGEFFEMLGLERREPEALRRAIGLYQRACGLLEQNHDPEISARTIQVSVSRCHQCLGEHQKALDILRSCNEGGVNNDLVGSLLVSLKRYDEAMEVLSESLLDTFLRLFRGAVGMVNCLSNGKKDGQGALELQEWICGLMESLHPGKPCYLDKMLAALAAGSAAGCAQLEREEEMEAWLRRAKARAEAFDAAPDYEMGNLRFLQGKSATAHDDVGQTAMEGVLWTLEAQDEPLARRLLEAWERLK